ncbi:Sma protein [Toxoplasma gondii FOU]|uniref:Sma protein n=1 Tax=Toxoplasma gondii FOU TaxID=943167 RepID=A0A086LIK9_TOXGO|nr:Sma protein [Toxoplasma gondii FOU]
MQQAQLAHAEAVAVANAVPDVELYGDQVVADELVDPEVLLDEEAQNIDPEAQRTTGAVKQKIDKDKMMKLLRSQIEHLPITPVKTLTDPNKTLSYLPYSSVEVVFNNFQLWGNLQNHHPACITYDMEDEWKWRPLLMEPADPIDSDVLLAPPIRDKKCQLLAEDLASSVLEHIRLHRMKKGLEVFFEHREDLLFRLTFYLDLLEYRMHLDDLHKPDPGPNHMGWSSFPDECENAETLQETDCQFYQTISQQTTLTSEEKAMPGTQEALHMYAEYGGDAYCMFANVPPPGGFFDPFAAGETSGQGFQEAQAANGWSVQFVRHQKPPAPELAMNPVEAYEQQIRYQDKMAKLEQKAEAKLVKSYEKKGGAKRDYYAPAGVQFSATQRHLAAPPSPRSPTAVSPSALGGAQTTSFPALHGSCQSSSSSSSLSSSSSSSSSSSLSSSSSSSWPSHSQSASSTYAPSSSSSGFSASSPSQLPSGAGARRSVSFREGTKEPSSPVPRRQALLRRLSVRLREAIEAGENLLQGAEAAAREEGTDEGRVPASERANGRRLSPQVPPSRPVAEEICPRVDGLAVTAESLLTRHRSLLEPSQGATDTNAQAGEAGTNRLKDLRPSDSSAASCASPRNLAFSSSDNLSCASSRRSSGTSASVSEQRSPLVLGGRSSAEKPFSVNASAVTFAALLRRMSQTCRSLEAQVKAELGGGNEGGGCQNEARERTAGDRGENSRETSDRDGESAEHCGQQPPQGTGDACREQRKEDRSELKGKRETQKKMKNGEEHCRDVDLLSSVQHPGEAEVVTLRPVTSGGVETRRNFSLADDAGEKKLRDQKLRYKEAMRRRVYERLEAVAGERSQRAAEEARREGLLLLKEAEEEGRRIAEARDACKAPVAGDLLRGLPASLEPGDRETQAETRKETETGTASGGDGGEEDREKADTEAGTREEDSGYSSPSQVSEAYLSVWSGSDSDDDGWVSPLLARENREKHKTSELRRTRGGVSRLSGESEESCGSTDRDEREERSDAKVMSHSPSFKSVASRRRLLAGLARGTLRGELPEDGQQTGDIRAPLQTDALSPSVLLHEEDDLEKEEREEGGANEENGRDKEEKGDEGKQEAGDVVRSADPKSARLSDQDAKKGDLSEKTAQRETANLSVTPSSSSSEDSASSETETLAGSLPPSDVEGDPFDPRSRSFVWGSSESEASEAGGLECSEGDKQAVRPRPSEPWQVYVQPSCSHLLFPRVELQERRRLRKEKKRQRAEVREAEVAGLLAETFDPDPEKVEETREKRSEARENCAEAGAGKTACDSRNQRDKQMSSAVRVDIEKLLARATKRKFSATAAGPSSRETELSDAKAMSPTVPGDAPSPGSNKEAARGARGDRGDREGGTRGDKRKNAATEEKSEGSCPLPLASPAAASARMREVYRRCREKASKSECRVSSLPSPSPLSGKKKEGETSSQTGHALKFAEERKHAMIYTLDYDDMPRKTIQGAWGAPTSLRPTAAEMNLKAPEGMHWDPLSQTYQYTYRNPYEDEAFGDQAKGAVQQTGEVAQAELNAGRLADYRIGKGAYRVNQQTGERDYIDGPQRDLYGQYGAMDHIDKKKDRQPQGSRPEGWDVGHAKAVYEQGVPAGYTPAPREEDTEALLQDLLLAPTEGADEFDAYDGGVDVAALGLTGSKPGDKPRVARVKPQEGFQGDYGAGYGGTASLEMQQQISQETPQEQIRAPTEWIRPSPTGHYAADQVAKWKWYYRMEEVYYIWQQVNFPVRNNHVFCGFPVHFSSSDVNDIRSYLGGARRFRKLLDIPVDNIVYAITAKCFPLMGGVISTWLFFGAEVPLISNQERERRMKRTKKPKHVKRPDDS